MAVVIPEGYGAWGDLATFSFSTTATYSCHGVAAWNPGMNQGGVYHVGANSLAEEQSAMEMMLSSLAATHCMISRGAMADLAAPGGMMNPLNQPQRQELIDESAEIFDVCAMYCGANIQYLGPQHGLMLQWTAVGGFQNQAGVGMHFDVTTHGNFAFNYVRAGHRTGANAQGFFRSM